MLWENARINLICEKKVWVKYGETETSWLPLKKGIQKCGVANITDLLIPY